MIFIACPNYGSLAPETTAALIQATTNLPTKVRFKRSSLLALNCNVLWCEALNSRDTVTHFVMCHSDIAPVDLDWLSKLVQEQQRVQADVLSVVVPVKDNRGVSSTAIVDLFV